MNNDRASALQVDHTCSTILGQELGMELSTQIKSWYERLIQSGEFSATTQKEKAPEGNEAARTQAGMGSIERGVAIRPKREACMFLILGDMEITIDPDGNIIGLVQNLGGGTIPSVKHTGKIGSSRLDADYFVTFPDGLTATTVLRTEKK